jgi:ADP-heptose:LPS heptosyltransferase
LLEPLGLFAPAVHFDLPESRAATANVAVFLQRSGLSGSFAVLNPGAGWDSRLWPPDRYARVARHLGRRHGLGSVVTWSGARELSWAKQIVSAAGAHTVLAPSTDLRELAALLRAAVLFVGSDTGPLHLAAAVGTVCVSMHGTTKREVSGPYGPGHIALQESYEPGSSGHRRRASDEAMRAIDADMVSRACDEVLAVAR